MTTNNHPANGPVSLDRLHQISEILSKAAAQSDGGNLGYAMADAVKVINGVLESIAREQVRREHAAWSQATFGDVGPVGPLKHLSKEALEAAAEPGDLSEWADMQFLLWDAQRRAGISDEQITQTMVEKLAINKQREWPEPKDGEPRLHIKNAGNSPVIGIDPASGPDRTVEVRYVAPPGYVMVPVDATRAMIDAAARVEEDGYAAMLQGKPVSNRDALPLDYLQGHKDGLEWAAQLTEANHPQTGDWLYDDPIELAKAIRKGPDMPDGDGNSLSKCSLREGVEAIRKSCIPVDVDKIQSECDAGNSPVTPDGWALVPVEPTEDMIVNGFESEPDESFSDEKEWEAYDAMSGCQQAAHRAKLCWSAMIAASPAYKKVNRQG